MVFQRNQDSRKMDLVLASVCLENFLPSFEALVHDSALMRQHFYLLVKTPSANLSRAIQWLL
jgi:hypothetical protein